MSEQKSHVNFNPDPVEHSFEVFDLIEDESLGTFPTLAEARGCVAYYRLRHYSIWYGNTRVECCDPYDGDDDRVKQALGQPNASEAGL